MGQSVSSSEHRGGDDVEHCAEEKCVAVLPFLEDMTKQNIQKLLSLCKRQEFNKGDVVVGKGQPAGFNVIISGQVQIIWENGEGKRDVLRQMNQGQWFGELFITEDCVLKQISAICNEDKTVVLSLTDEQFKKMSNTEPEIAVCLSPISDGSVRVKLRSVTFLQGLDEILLQQLSWLFDFRRRKAGTHVCKQHDESDGFYIVASGHCSVSVFDEESQSNIHLGSLQPGEWFGEISLIEETKRTADVIAVKDCVFLYLSPDNFQKFIKIQSQYAGSSTGLAFEKIIKKRTAASLKAVPLFSVLITKEIGPVRRFDEEKLSLLGDLFKFVEFKENEVIYSAGDKSDSMFVIVSGTGRETVQIGENEEECNALKKNDCFGESALFSESDRTTKVTATSDVVCLKLLRENFNAFLQVSPDIKRGVENLMVDRTGGILAKIPFFRGLKENKPWSKISLLGGIFQFEYFHSGDTIFEEGELGDKFYVIIEGTLEASVKIGDEIHKFGTMGPDQFFGEMALMNKTTRSATVKSITSSTLMSLSTDNYCNFRSIAPELQTKIASFVEARTANTMKTIPLFRDLKENKPWSKLDMLASLFSFEQFHQGDIISEDTSKSDKFYVILSGKTKVQDLESDGEEIFEAGDFFGEMAFLEALGNDEDAKIEFSHSKITATEETLIISLERDQFEKFLKVAPEAEPRMRSGTKTLSREGSKKD